MGLKIPGMQTKTPRLNQHGRWETARFQTLVKCQKLGSFFTTTSLTTTCLQHEVADFYPPVRTRLSARRFDTKTLPLHTGMCVWCVWCVCAHWHMLQQRPLPRSAREGRFEKQEPLETRAAEKPKQKGGRAFV